MTDAAVLLDAPESGIARITLSNPTRLNAMRLSMWARLGDICAQLATDLPRVVVLRGDPGARGFCSGADISEFSKVRTTPDAIAAYNGTVARALDALAHLPMPVIGAVHGACIGGGLELALRCDLRIATSDARFAFTPAKLGLAIGPDEVAALNRVVGPTATAELLYTAQPVDAAHAERWGLINRITEPDTLDETVSEVGRIIAANAPLTLRAVKASLRAAGRPGDARAARHADDLVRTCYDSSDYVEGQRAFAEKRAPRFTGA